MSEKKPREFFLSWIHSYSNGRLSQVTHNIVENPDTDSFENNGLHVVEMEAVIPLLEALKKYSHEEHHGFTARQALAPWADVMEKMK